jgi:hypothetical protein
MMISYIQTEFIAHASSLAFEVLAFHKLGSDIAHFGFNSPDLMI